MTENSGEEPAEAAVETLAPPTRRRIRRPGRLDPGWATLVAAALALVGTLATVFYRGSSDDPQPKAVTATSTDGTQAAAAATAPSTVPATTATTSTTSTTSTSVAADPPTVSLLSALPADQRAAVNAVSAQLISSANLLPLIVHDEFANNDYAWPQDNQTYAGGIQCSWAIADNEYDIAVHSVNGPAFCRSGLSKVASNFVLSVDMQLQNDRNSDIGLLFRYLDDTNHYELVYTPETQTMSVSYVGPDGASPILTPTYVAEIKASGSNQITVLALGTSMTVSVNGTLVVAIANETRITSPGQILVREWLNEPNADEVLSLTRFDLRGS